MNARTALLAASLCLAGCVDLEGAYERCLDAGRCNVEVNNGGGGGGGAGGGGGGGGATDSGVDAGPYDGGAPCPGVVNAHPRLRCSAPIAVGTATTTATHGVLAANDDFFIVGWADATSYQVWSVTPAGVQVALLTGMPHVAGKEMISVAGEAHDWAVVWANRGDRAVQCQATGMAAPVTVPLPDGGAAYDVSAAVNANRGVGIGAIDNNNFYGGRGLTSCPSQLYLLPSFQSTNGISAVHTPGNAGIGDDGFRFVCSGQINALNGAVEVKKLENGAPLPDGGIIDQSYVSNGLAPGGNSAAVSTAGDNVLIAVSLDDGNGNVQLDALAMASNLVAVGTPRQIDKDPGFWVMSNAGPGVAAAAQILYTSSAPATVHFLTDDLSMSPLGDYDAVCGLGAFQFVDESIGLAYSGGKLGVLYVTANGPTLSICDVPPLH